MKKTTLQLFAVAALFCAATLAPHTAFSLQRNFSAAFEAKSCTASGAWQCDSGTGCTGNQTCTATSFWCECVDDDYLSEIEEQPLELTEEEAQTIEELLFGR